ncbi:serine threonine kinase 16 [Trichoderma arundinaceum]|uniref:Serine threonine kinase 16 n=1 Tax=Trichoderma arundinaceum TaxID=490622 RepID=A0A395NDQ3_TRIAR|nr:serine threonine kinase 16 [Trichoderma arundinaceum]
MERAEHVSNPTPVASRIEREVEADLVPGTEVMTAMVGATSDNQDSIVLIPQPTNDPHDPLNWSTLWKTLVIVNQGIFVITSVIPTMSIAPLTPIFMQQWQKSLTDVALLTGVTVILLGYCNFIIIPSCEIFGRRVTLLVCAILNFGACIWQATATSYGSFLAARILAGTGASANESIMNVVVTDIYFLHERGKYVGSYFWCYFMGLFLGPIISGAVTQHVSFRVFFWACTGAQGVNIIGLLFFFPETRRLQAKSPIPCVLTSEETNMDNTKLEMSAGHAEFVSSPQIQNLQTEIQGRGRPSRSQFGIFQVTDRTAWRSVVRHFFTPAYILFFPIIFWASMSMGSAANALLAVNILQSPGLAAPPYNFTPAQVGYANFALVVGGVLGLAVAGPWSDYVSQKATIRNKGIREPEMRLVSLSPFIAVVIVGLIVRTPVRKLRGTKLIMSCAKVFGVGLQDKWPWPAIIIVGFGFVGVQVVAIPTITITYAIDCYRPISGEIMAIATVCKNTFGFGMTYFVNDWAAADGFVPPVMLLMAMTAGFTMVGMVALIFYGKSCRRRTRNSKVHSF